MATKKFPPFMGKETKAEEAKEMKSKVEKILSFLKGRDAEIVKACYGINQAAIDIEDKLHKWGSNSAGTLDNLARRV